MRRVAPGSDWDVRRFRPNVLVDDGAAADAPAEPDLVGGELSAPSGLRLRIGLPTPRCVVPTRAREDLPADPGLLKQIARQGLWDLGPFGRGACLGVYAEVAGDGRLAVGERLAFAPRAAGTAEDAAAATAARVAASLLTRGRGSCAGGRQRRLGGVAVRSALARVSSTNSPGPGRRAANFGHVPGFAEGSVRPGDRSTKVALPARETGNIGGPLGV